MKLPPELDESGQQINFKFSVKSNPVESFKNQNQKDEIKYQFKISQSMKVAQLLIAPLEETNQR